MLEPYWQWQADRLQVEVGLLRMALAEIANLPAGTPVETARGVAYAALSSEHDLPGSQPEQSDVHSSPGSSESPAL